MNVFKTKVLDLNLPLPYKKHESDAGYDIYAAEDTWVLPFQTKVIPSNHSILIENHLFGAMFPRSSIRKKGWLIEGIIDEGFTGYFKIIVTNINLLPRKIKKGERVCQMVFLKYEDVKFNFVNEYETITERGDGGFGHTGRK
jgi:dUTP pyrophosphatase